MKTWHDLTAKEMRHQYRRTLKFLKDAKRHGGEMEEAYISVAVGALKGIREAAPSEMRSEIEGVIRAYSRSIEEDDKQAS